MNSAAFPAGSESTPQGQKHLTPSAALARHLNGPAYLAQVVERSYWEVNS